MEEVLLLDLVLPWPSRRLSPNARVHWKGRIGETARVRREAFFITQELEPEKRVGLRELCLLARYTFNAPDMRKRDMENLIAPCKPAIDGIFDALDADDCRIIRVLGEWGELDRPSGSVRLRLYELDCSEDKRGKY